MVALARFGRVPGSVRLAEEFDRAYRLRVVVAEGDWQNMIGFK